MRRLLSSLVLLCVCAQTAHARAHEVQVAVAANFAHTLEAVGSLFRVRSGHTLRVSPGSSGALFSQIKAGAPFDVFLSADAERPKMLEDAGLGVQGSRFVYAQGKLVLWSPDPEAVDPEGKVLQKLGDAKVGIADPSTAPYGGAAREVLSALGLWTRLAPKHAVVIGSSVTHAYQFAATKNVRCAFVALSQVLSGPRRGSRWVVPQTLYTPLRQEAVLLRRGQKSAAARAFLDFLRDDPQVHALLREAGYGLPAP
jgi:molybdate transport system substrate-binding protein